MSISRLGCALSLLLGACGGAQAPAAARPQGACGDEPNARHPLQVYLAVDRSGVSNALCPGQELTGSDTLWVTVELDAAAFVRMVFITSQGETGELLRRDPSDVTQQALFRAPPGLMTRSMGSAQLVIVASRNPLGDADPMLASTLDVIRETGVLVNIDGTLTPPSRLASSPDEQQLFNLGSDSLHAEFDPHGVAVLALNLHTAP